MNPNSPLPDDAAADQRDPPSSNPRGGDHPSHASHDQLLTTGDYDYDVGSQDSFNRYCGLVDACQRHRHNEGYCMRQKYGARSCRHDFPRPLLTESRLVVLDRDYQISSKSRMVQCRFRRKVQNVCFCNVNEIKICKCKLDLLKKWKFQKDNQ